MRRTTEIGACDRECPQMCDEIEYSLRLMVNPWPRHGLAVGVKRKTGELLARVEIYFEVTIRLSWR